MASVSEIKQSLEETFEVSHYDIDHNGWITAESCYMFRHIEKIPDILKIAHVQSFYCDSSNLTSLKGCPKSIELDFDCSRNKRLTSLEGGPTTVGGSYSCAFTSITSLAGAPERIGSNFDCDRTKIENLIGGPTWVGRNYYCDGEHMDSLEGAPDHVGMNFNTRCSDFKNLPKHIGKDLCIIWSPTLPVLSLLCGRTFLAHSRRLFWVQLWQKARKYLGNSSSDAVIACATELIQSGFFGNARL